MAETNPREPDLMRGSGSEEGWVGAVEYKTWGSGESLWGEQSGAEPQPTRWWPVHLRGRH